MHPVLITTDPVLLSFAAAVLADSGVESRVADQYTSAIEGSLGIFPRRLLVPVAALHRARRALTEAGLAAELPTAPADEPLPVVARGVWLLGRRT